MKDCQFPTIPLVHTLTSQCALFRDNSIETDMYFIVLYSLLCSINGKL